MTSEDFSASSTPETGIPQISRASSLASGAAAHGSVIRSRRPIGILITCSLEWDTVFI